MFLPRLVPLGFVLAAWVAALSVVLFFSPVRPRHLACFSLGSFLCFLVRGSSLLGPFLLFFSPLCVSCPFLGDLPAISRSVSSSGEDLFLSSLPDVRAMAESSSNPLPRSFRVLSFHVVWVLFRLHSFCALFVNPSCLLWLAIPSRPRFLSSRSLAQIALSFFIRDIISQASSSTSSSSLPISASSSLRVPCVLPLLLGRTVFAVLRLVWLLLTLLLFPPFWSRPHTVHLQCSRPFPFELFFFLLARVSIGPCCGYAFCGLVATIWC